MIAEKEARRKRCKHCNRILDRTWFTAPMTEEWSWNGEGYNECTARHSLVTDEELLHGKAVDMPPQTQTSVTFAKAPKVSQKEGEQLAMS